MKDIVINGITIHTAELVIVIGLLFLLLVLLSVLNSMYWKDKKIDSDWFWRKWN